LKGIRAVLGLKHACRRLDLDPGPHSVCCMAAEPGMQRGGRISAPAQVVTDTLRVRVVCITIPTSTVPVEIARYGRDDRVSAWKSALSRQRWAVVWTLATVLAATTMSGASPSSGYAASDQPGSGRWRPFSASAPCKPSANIAVRVSHNSRLHHRDHLRVRVTTAPPQTRWKVEVQFRDKGVIHLNLYQVRADRRGQWTIRDLAGHGYTTLHVTATSAHRQRCRITLSGQVALS
jgi:hypothetical protein